MQTGFSIDPAKPMIREIEWIGKNKFNFFELYSEGMAPNHKLEEQVLKTKKKYSLGAVGHLTWHLATGFPEKSNREDAVAQAIRELESMKKFEIAKATVHANWHPSLGEKDSIKFQAESLREIHRNAKAMGILLVLELTDTPRDTEKNISSLLGEVPGMMLNLDIGHANISSRNPVSFIKKFQNKIAHVHMHDNDGTMDMHLPLGQGIIDWKAVVSALKESYDDTITLEVFRGGREFVLLSRKRLLRLWNSK